MPPVPNLAAESARAAGLLAAGRAGDAAEIYRGLLANAPKNGALHFNFACALQGIGNLPDAIAHYLEALKFKPDLVPAANNLGNAYLAAGRPEDAAASFRRALEMDPNHQNALVCLGGLYLDAGQHAESLKLLERGVARYPDNFNARVLLSQACDRADRRDEADLHLAKAAELQPADAKVRNNIATRLLQSARLDEAMAAIELATKLDPAAAEIHSNLIMNRLYLPDISAADHLSEARNWNARHGAPRAGRFAPPTNPREPERRLRIGYVSADFYRHPVGFFMAGPLAQHDRTSFEIFCYSNGRHDAYTAKLRHDGDTWRDIRRLPDDDLVRLIRADGIDILVDLAGHTAANRLTAFALRAAPIQITGGGHTGTTGLDAIDYLITDRFETPAELAVHYSETPIRMPHGYVCYTPPDYAPPVGPSPFGEHGYITFCCFNNISKLNAKVIAVWARIMKQVPDSRLTIQARPLRQDSTADRIRALFAAQGIAPERLVMGGGADHERFLPFYNQADIALDPFPYSGGLTTLEALWMGVPVVTRPGENFAGRHSLSHLSNLGLGELVARDADDYVRIASDLARDRERLAALRPALRPRMAQSPLCDAVGYTQALEAAYRDVWRKWCGSSGNQT